MSLGAGCAYPVPALTVSSPAVYENEDQLLWDPGALPEREVEEFLYRAAKRRWQEVAGSQLPEGEAVKDSEQVGPVWGGEGTLASGASVVVNLVKVLVVEDAMVFMPLVSLLGGGVDTCVTCRVVVQMPLYHSGEVVWTPCPAPRAWEGELRLPAGAV